MWDNYQSLMFISLESQKEKRGTFEWKYWLKTPRFGEMHTLTYLRSSLNSKYNKLKENDFWICHNQSSEN